MSLKAVIEKLSNPKALSKLELKNIYKTAAHKPLTAEQEKYFIEEMRHAEEIIKLHAEAESVLNKALQNMKK